VTFWRKGFTNEAGPSIKSDDKNGAITKSEDTMSELEQCQKQLAESQNRAAQAERLLSLQAAEHRQAVDKLNQVNAGLLRQAKELKTANQTLIESEQRLRFAVETGLVGLFVWDSTDVKNPGDWSNQLKEIFGLPLDAEVTHDMFLKCVHPDDRDHIDQCVQRALMGENGGEYKTEYRTIRPDDGSEHWVTARGQAFFNSEGKAFRFIGTVMDITERKRAEQALNQLNMDLEKRISQRLAELAKTNEALRNEITERKRIENRLRQSQAYLAEAQRLSRTGSFGWIVAPEEFIWSEETFCIFGFDQSTVLTLDLILSRVHPEDLAFVKDELERATKTESGFDFSHRLLFQDGTIRHLHVTAKATKNATGLFEFIGAVQDISEHTLSDEALRRSEAYLAEAQKLSKTGSFCIRAATQELICSEGTIRIGGWPSGTIPTIQQSIERVHPDDRVRVQTMLEKALSEGSLLEYEHRLLMDDGSVRFVHTVANPMRNASGEMEFVGAVMDVTEQTRIAEALRASEHLARGQLSALTRTLELLSQEPDPDKLPKHVVSTIMNQMGAHSATIWERNGHDLDLIGINEDGRFKSGGEAGYFGGSIPADGQAPPLWVEALWTGTYLVIEDINIEPSRIILPDGRSATWRTEDLTAPFADLKTHLLKQGVRGLLISPMMLAGDLVGIIGVRFTGTRTFQPEEIELTKALAHQAMLAMQLTRLSKQSRESAVVAERNRLARDIHDTLAQGFTGVIMQLEAAKGATVQGNFTEVAKRIDRAGALARSSLGEARRSVRALRPSSLREGKLFVALENLLKNMTEESGLNAELHPEGDDQSLPPEWEEGLLRITQEALTNAVKHAKARNFTAALTVGAKTVQLQLVDDGQGFDPQADHDGFGLIGMKERVDRMKGKFTIRTKVGAGTEIIVELQNQDAPKLEDSDAKN
jgi:PAS domain S-box-containing protein